jgi:hypothetical protein
MMTSFYTDNSLPKFDAYHREDCEHDDYMTAEDYDRKEYYRNGWDAERYDSQRW